VINRSLRPIPGATTASHALLDTTANLLGELHAQAPSDLSDSYQARLANAYDGMADVLELQSALLLAKTTYEKALAIRLTLLQHTPSDPVRRQEAVATYLLHGDLLRTQGQQRLALIDYEQAETLLEPMWKREPDKKSYRWQMCGVLYRISQTQLSLGKSAASLAQAETGVGAASTHRTNGSAGRQAITCYYLACCWRDGMRGKDSDRAWLRNRTTAEHSRPCKDS
jgi:tetratricopeptide (TPR) repeat protein